ncbi:MAG: GGDEF domain-containing protein [Hyphomonas sp.]
MSAQLFVALLNPGISLLLAAAFLILWMNQRGRRHILLAAAGFAAMTLGSLIQDVGPSLPMQAERFVSNLSYLLAAAMIATAIIERRGAQAPIRVYATIIGATMTAVIWFLLIQPDLNARIFTVNLGLGAIAALLAVQLWSLPRPHLVDRLMLGTAILSAANYLVRPVAIAWMMNGIGSYEISQQSLYWTTMQFSQAMISIIFALNLMVAIAIDLVADLKREASLDKLSGLLNRRGFEAAANRRLERCHEEKIPVSLLIADLDEFKRINDTWGHATGDRVIGLFGARVAKLNRPDMVAGRIGGEEFAVLIPGLDAGAARLFAEALRASLCAHGAGDLPGELVPTTSIGVCQAEPGADLYELLNNADLALYDAKRAGRNRVRVFGQMAADVPAQRARKA